MNVKTGLGLLLLAASAGQLLAPRRVFDDPERLFGLPVVPVFVLGAGTTLFTVGVILLGEGVCQRFGAPSLAGMVIDDPVRLPWLLLGGVTAGVVLELSAQWLGRLWFYPYWTPWFYGLIVLPGFAFYWLSIVASYLAAKAVLDAVARPGPRVSITPAVPLLLGALTLLTSLTCTILWYARRGFSLAPTHPVPAAPPFFLIAAALTGAALLAQGLLLRRRLCSPAGAVRHGYWVPGAAVLLASVVLSVVMEILNTAHHHWAYAHFPGPAVAGVPVLVFVAWPVQYLIFLLVPSLVVPGLADLLWRPTPGRDAAGRPGTATAAATAADSAS
ncbi:hypothetical protein [Hamadaea tsunoensis]|uniref:hypothetical protein n=1 Tax=Hamadaea tsunoensis TaxID=53368 RepID=UPI0004856949|nr:hypothetical protein [Hamadaea tsunoensis]